MGVGLGVIAGSLLIILPPQLKEFRLNNKTSLTRNSFSSKGNKGNTLSSLFPSKESNEIIPLSNKWKELAQKEKGLEASGYILFEDGRYAQLDHETPLPAASTINIPILFVALEMLDRGLIDWDERKSGLSY